MVEIAESILRAHSEISVEKKLSEEAILFSLMGKTFLMRLPDQDNPRDTARIYLYNDDGFDFPHIMLQEVEINNIDKFPKGSYRYVCLYEQGSVIHALYSYEEKIDDATTRLIELMNMGRVAREREFQKEFMFYWNQASSGKPVVNIFLRHKECFSKMRAFYSKNEIRYIEEELSLSDLERTESGSRVWQQHLERDIFYIPITNCRGILPPHRGYNWTADTIRDIVSGKQIDHISRDTYKTMRGINAKTQDIVLVFGMHGKEAEVCFAAKIKNTNFCVKNSQSLMDRLCDGITAVEPLYTKRKDYLFLSDQIGNDIGLMDKRVLLIGAGSLGSYVASELVKNGVSDLTIYDGDVLEEDNILRWSYTGFGIGCNKAFCLKVLLESIHPEIKVRAEGNNLKEEMLPQELKESDLIIFTIGSSDQQLYFNQVLKDLNCQIPVLYVWLEEGGRYSHICLIDYNKPGCYQCLFTGEDENLINNRANINDEEAASVAIIKNGCGGTRAAYGTAVLLRTTAALLDIIRKLLSGMIIENTVIDVLPERIEYQSGIIPVKGCKCCGNREKKPMCENEASE